MRRSISSRAYAMSIRDVDCEQLLEGTEDLGAGAGEERGGEGIVTNGACKLRAKNTLFYLICLRLLNQAFQCDREAEFVCVLTCV
jgi:hypothetical protein